jgi:hypothetical protein
MNAIIIPIVTSYGAFYLVKYAVDCFAAAFFNKTYEIAGASVKSAVTYVKGSPKEEPTDIDSIQYEFVDIMKDDEIVYVTSKKRKESLNENWNEVDENELLEIQNIEIAKKICTPRLNPNKSAEVKSFDRSFVL